MSVSDLQVRLVPMLASDLARVAEMNQHLQEDEGTDIMTIEQIEARLHRWIDSGWYGVVLIKNEKDVVGYILYATEPLESTSIYIRQLFIERDHRRKGFGAAAVQAFARDHIEPGRPIEIDVLTVNESGRAFWEAIGFLPCHTRMRLDRVNSADG